MVLGLILQSTFILVAGIIMEVLAAISILLIFCIQNLFKKNNIQRLKELSNENYFEIKTIFNEYELGVINITIQSKTEIKYEYFIGFAETPNIYSLVTKSGEQIIIFKNCLNNEEINTFKEFIKEKCKNIKW